MTTLAYHNDASLKQNLVAEMRKHRELDMLRQGETGYDGKGCTVACALHSLTGTWAYDHAILAAQLGVPQQIPQLADAIFEGLRHDEAMGFGQAWLDAINTGADLSLVWPRFAHWLLADESSPMFKAAQREACRDAVLGVACLYGEWVEYGVKPDKQRWDAARAAAWEAAWAATRAAAWAATRAAAWAATDAAWEAALEASLEAAREAAREAAWEAAWNIMADKFLELLRAAPVNTTA